MVTEPLKITQTSTTYATTTATLRLPLGLQTRHADGQSLRTRWVVHFMRTLQSRRYSPRKLHATLVDAEQVNKLKMILASTTAIQLLNDIAAAASTNSTKLARASSRRCDLRSNYENITLSPTSWLTVKITSAKDPASSFPSELAKNYSIGYIAVTLASTAAFDALATPSTGQEWHTQFTIVLNAAASPAATNWSGTDKWRRSTLLPSPSTLPFLSHLSFPFPPLLLEV